MTLALGTQTEFTTDTCENMQVAMLDATTGLAAWATSAGAYAVKFTVSGTTIDVKTSGEYTISSTAHGAMFQLRRVSSTHALLIYRVSTPECYAVVLTYSGDNVSGGTPVTLPSTGMSHVRTLAEVDSSKFMAAYRDANDTNKGKAVIITVSGTTPTIGSAFTFDTATVYSPMVAQISTSQALCMYGDSANSDDWRAGFLNFTGTTINTFTNEQSPSAIPNDGPWTTSEYNQDLARADANNFFLTHKSNIAGGITASIVTVSGTTITLETTDQISLASSAAASITALSATKGIVQYIVASATLNVVEFDINGTGDGVVSVDSVEYDSSAGTAVIDIDMGSSTTFTLADRGSGYVTAGTLASSASHIWLSSDGGATFADIGDSATWGSNLVGGVVVKPGTSYQSIWAIVGTTVYRTANGGTSWASVATVGYEADFIELLDGGDDDILFVAKRDAAGTNRASLVNDTTSAVVHINTGKSTSGGATSGQGVA